MLPPPVPFRFNGNMRCLPRARLQCGKLINKKNTPPPPKTTVAGAFLERDNTKRQSRSHGDTYRWPLPSCGLIVAHNSNFSSAPKLFLLHIPPLASAWGVVGGERGWGRMWESVGVTWHPGTRRTPPSPSNDADEEIHNLEKLLITITIRGVVENSQLFRVYSPTATTTA